MKKDLQDKAVEILTQIQSGVQAGADFAAREIPDIAWSYVLYGRVYYTAAWLFCVAVLVISLLAIRSGVKLDRSNRDGFHLWFPGLIAAVTSSVFAFGTFSNTLLVWLAPKLWLIKEIVGLVK